MIFLGMLTLAGAIANFWMYGLTGSVWSLVVGISCSAACVMLIVSES